jgi:hypothetical protein
MEYPPAKTQDSPLVTTMPPCNSFQFEKSSGVRLNKSGGGEGGYRGVRGGYSMVTPPLTPMPPWVTQVGAKVPTPYAPMGHAVQSKPYPVSPHGSRHSARKFYVSRPPPPGAVDPAHALPAGPRRAPIERDQGADRRAGSGGESPPPGEAPRWGPSGPAKGQGPPVQIFCIQKNRISSPPCFAISPSAPES